MRNDVSQEVEKENGKKKSAEVDFLGRTTSADFRYLLLDKF